jgi:hypothetical protein
MIAMTTKLRYQITRDELIEEVLLLHFQKYPVQQKEPVPVSNPRIEYLQKRQFPPLPEKMDKPNDRIEYLEKVFRERQTA